VNEDSKSFDDEQLNEVSKFFNNKKVNEDSKSFNNKEDSKSFDDEMNENSKSFDDEEINEDSKSFDSSFDDEENNEDSKSFDNEKLNENWVSTNQELIKNSFAYNEDREKYSNNDLKTDNIEFVYKNSFLDKEENVIKGTNSNYFEYIKSNYNKNNNKLANNKYEEYPKSEDNGVVIDEYERDPDNKDINMDDFEHEISNYDKRPSEKNPIMKSKYSIQWVVLRNSDITNSSEVMIYLNKIGREFHLTKP
ncbi:10101_t:CDS:1, partial [Dentiscutata heterogama]